MDVPSQHPRFDPPTAVTFPNVPVARDTRRVVVASEAGHWSNCDLYIVAPTDLTVLAGAQLVGYSRSRFGRGEVFRGDLASLLWSDFANLKRQARVSVRGAVAEGFIWELEDALDPTTVPPWILQLELRLWGTESTPEAAGEDLAQTLERHRSPPIRGAVLLGDTGTGLRTVHVTAAGDVVTSGGAGGSVVRGDKTVDTSHAAPTDAIDERAHGYTQEISFVFPGPTVSRGAWFGAPATKNPALWFSNDADATSPRVPMVSSTLQCLAADSAFSTWLRFEAPWLDYATPAALGPLFTPTGGLVAAQVTRAILTASTGSAFRGVLMNQDSGGQRVAPYFDDYDGLPVQPIVNALGKQIVVPGLPEVSDTEDAPTPAFADGTVGPSLVLKAGPGWLLSLDASVRPVV